MLIQMLEAKIIFHYHTYYRYMQIAIDYSLVGITHQTCHVIIIICLM